MMLYSIGHSTRTFSEFENLLSENKIDVLVDVRSMPGSRKYPHFNRELLEYWVPCEYEHFATLGGRRRGQDAPPETNAGWTQASFRNYADYGLCEEYRLGIDGLLRLAEDSRVAYMCSEAVPWRCHRNLISNSLVARGVSVEHIIGPGKTVPHYLGRWGAKPLIHSDNVLTYPALLD